MLVAGLDSKGDIGKEAELEARVVSHACRGIAGDVDVLVGAHLPPTGRLTVGAVRGAKGVNHDVAEVLHFAVEAGEDGAVASGPGARHGVGGALGVPVEKDVGGVVGQRVAVRPEVGVVPFGGGAGLALVEHVELAVEAVAGGVVALDGDGLSGGGGGGGGDPTGDVAVMVSVVGDGVGGALVACDGVRHVGDVDRVGSDSVPGDGDDSGGGVVLVAGVGCATGAGGADPGPGESASGLGKGGSGGEEEEKCEREFHWMGLY